MPHAYSRLCGYCGCLTEQEQRDFDRRVERLRVVRHDGKPVTSVEISRCDGLYAYCDKACWRAAEPALAVVFDLQSTYPPFGFISSCSRCGASVDRTHDYVCLSISKMTYPQDGSAIAVCSSARDWAVLCNTCEQPDGPSSASTAIASPVPELAR